MASAAIRLLSFAFLLSRSSPADGAHIGTDFLSGSAGLRQPLDWLTTSTPRRVKREGKIPGKFGRVLGGRRLYSSLVPGDLTKASLLKGDLPLRIGRSQSRRCRLPPMPPSRACRRGTQTRQSRGRLPLPCQLEGLACSRSRPGTARLR